MKRTHLFGTMMACTLAAAVSVGAQDRPAQAPSDREDKTVVVTGCLKSGPQATTPAPTGTSGTTGTTGTSGSAGAFVLADAKLATGAASSATATTGSTAGTAGSTSEKKKSFTLVGGPSSELQGFVNSKVEITGSIDQTAGATAPSTTPSMSPASDQAKLKVTSVKQMAASCDPGQP